MNLSHLAATNRKHFTSACNAIINKNIIQKGDTHLDYGCGRGSDVEKMRSLGYKSSGYDPYYFPEEPQPADIVTMNYILNVIEDPKERLQAIARAWSLTNKCLLIVANVAVDKEVTIDPGRYSSRGVYYKKFRTQELRSYIEVATNYPTKELNRHQILVERAAEPVKTWSHSEVEKLCDRLKHKYIAPINTFIRLDHRKIKNARLIKEYRMISQERNIPGVKKEFVKKRWLGQLGDDRLTWAIKGMRRRNIILRAKFRCKELSYLEDIARLSYLNFLNDLNSGITW